jgi:L-fucose isomerase-like protein
MSSTPAGSAAGAARFALFVAVSAIHDPAALARHLEPFLAQLRSLGAQSWDGIAERPDAPLAVFVATGGTERGILDAVAGDPREPVLLVAHPGQNSLPASLEVLARLQQMGRRGRIHYLAGAGDADGFADLQRALGDLAVRRALHASRIGVVGEPSDWLVASRPTPGTVREVWGPTVVPLTIDSLLAEPNAKTVTLGATLGREFGAAASATVEPAESDLDASGRVLAVLRRVVQRAKLDAVTVRCFDLVVRRGMTGCLALSQLTDDGVMAGCEGDLVSTVAMLWLRLMFGEVPWMANPSRVDRARGTLLLAHCTVPRGAAGAYRLRSHFESGLGVGVQGELPAGPVTLVRLGGLHMELLRVHDGELVANTDHADLCRTQAEIAIGRDALDELLAHPLGNHMIMIPGHRAAALRRWHDAMIA